MDLPKTSIWYTIFVYNYYRKLALSKDFKLVPTCKEALFKLLKNIEVTTAACVDQILSKFLKNRAWNLAMPINELCNLSIPLTSFPDACKIAKLKTLFQLQANNTAIFFTWNPSKNYYWFDHGIVLIELQKHLIRLTMTYY